VNLLVVEDNQRVREFLARGLEAEGYAVTTADSGEAALTETKRQTFDLILLDLMLPDQSGLEVCEQLRSQQNMTPILMLTAMNTTEDTIRGLRAGADDYLAKPFDVDELLARIEALIRRRDGYGKSGMVLQSDTAQQLVAGPLVLDRTSCTVFLDGQPVEMTAKELAMLEFFMRAPGKVFTREQILDGVWGQTEDPLTNIIDVYIRRLRIKIGQAGGESEEESLTADNQTGSLNIKTIRGIGYKLEVPATGKTSD